MLLQECPGALRSDLNSIHHVKLDDLFRGNVGLFEVSDYVQDLPPGSAVWRALGGTNAWTNEMQLLTAIEHNTRILWWLKTKDGSKGSNPPKMIEPPKSTLEDAITESRVEAVRRRQRSRKHNN